MFFHQISPPERSHFQSRIAALEKEAVYPIGDDFFQIDHGDDYFAFFERLGQVKYYIGLDNSGDRVVAVGAWVLRQIPDSPHCTWYLCDFKVHPAYQRQLLSLRLLRYAIAQNKETCDRGYAISMNSGCDRANRLVKAFCRFPQMRFRHAINLGIYSLDAASMQTVEPLLISHRGPISYCSLKGIKDLRLQSSGQVLPLLHVQWGGNGCGHRSQTIIPEPLPGHTHMFCVPEKDELTGILTQKGFQPEAIASVISHGMDSNDWRFILTSDI
ncbi:MAG: hypothetical protein KTR27_14790 [Leptolyngbyaceae cyanobacterium MAG.088]|nr:hypothetical protein [Leptolyngbyaceae cyanobacterium MAG.088]